MCGLFGVVNYGGAKEDVIRGLVSSLGKASEIRGTDASGIAYIEGGLTPHLSVQRNGTPFSRLPITASSSRYMQDMQEILLSVMQKWEECR